MNRGYFKVPLKKRFIQLFSPDYIMEFLKSMRKVQYYTYRGGIPLIINKLKYFRLSRKLGFSIGYNSLKNAHFCTLYTQFIGEFLYI